MLRRRPTLALLWIAVSALALAAGPLVAAARADKDAGIPIIAPTTPLGPQPPAGGELPYVIAPETISPAHGKLVTNDPIYREPYLLWTDHGLVTGFMEIPSSDTPNRLGWTCTSSAGAQWSCSPVSRGPAGTDWADPWITDSRGDPCPTYGHGLTMVALIATGNDILLPVAYYSLDFGKTWAGPTTLPYPLGTGDEWPISDGTKVIYTGRLYAGWRDYTYMTGAYVSQLQPNCTWGNAINITTWDGSYSSPQPGYDDGSDHLRLAATPQYGGLAVRASISDLDVTFHQFDPFLHQTEESIIGPTSPAESKMDLCPMLQDCPQASYDLARTLLWDPSSHQYITVFDKYDLGGPNPTGTGLFSTISADDGATWSAETELAGPSVDGSYGIMEPTMAFDKATGDALLAYYEIPDPNSYTAYLELRVMRPGATAWSRAYRIRTISYNSPQGQEQRFGDYFGLDAHAGVAYVDQGLYDQRGGHIEFFSVRYPK